MQYRLDQRDDVLTVEIEGKITEQSAAGLTTLRKDIGTRPRFAFDMGKVAFINSIGAGLWARFIRSLGSDQVYEYYRCSVFLIDYANMSPELIKGAAVRSFYAPFRCARCGREQDYLFDMKPGLRNADLVVAEPCGKCGEAMALETSAGSYLEFLESDSNS